MMRGFHIKIIVVLSLFYFFSIETKAQHFIGIRGGASSTRVSFNPSQRDSSTFQWMNVGLVYKYYKTEWTGLQVGLNYIEKGFVLNDTTRTYSVLELPLLSQFHYEAWKIRIIANVGAFIAYQLDARESFTENGAEVKRGYDFKSRDNRVEYGMHLGGGLGIMLHPIEVQFEVGYQYSFSYLLKPQVEGQPTMFTHFTQLMFSVGILYKL
jgi:hypothetical protein